MDLLYRLRGRPSYCWCGAKLIVDLSGFVHDRKTGLPIRATAVVKCPKHTFIDDPYAASCYGNGHDYYQWTQKLSKPEGAS